MIYIDICNRSLLFEKEPFNKKCHNSRIIIYNEKVEALYITQFAVWWLHQNDMNKSFILNYIKWWLCAWKYSSYAIEYIYEQSLYLMVNIISNLWTWTHWYGQFQYLSKARWVDHLPLTQDQSTQDLCCFRLQKGIHK